MKVRTKRALRGIFSATILTLTLIPSLAQTSFLQAGVKEGGGGDLLPVMTVSSSDVVSAINMAPAAVYAMYAQYSIQYGRGLQYSYMPKLYDGGQSILDIVASTQVETPMQSACQSPLGAEDGSGPGSTPDSICISVFNLSQKLTYDDVLPQVFALMAREYSHLLGTDESEAFLIQQYAYAQQSKNWPAQNVAFQSAHALAAVFAIQASMIEVGSGFSKITQQLEAQFMSLAKPLPGDLLAPVDLLGLQDYRLLNGYTLKAHALGLWACSADSTQSAVTRHGCRDQYRQIFAGAPEVSLMDIELEQRLNYNVNAPQDFVLRNISGISSARLELQDIQHFALQLINRFSTVAALGK